MSAAPRPSITEGPLVPAVIHLAWPVIVAESLHTAFHVVDIMWVQGLGTAATAAAATSTYAVWILTGLGHLLTFGVIAHVSRAVGARDPDSAGRAAAQGLNLALILGVVAAIAGWFGAAPLFALVGTSPEVSALAVTYLRVTALGAPATFLYLGAGAIMRAAGNTRTPMLVTAAAVGANVLLTPLLMYGVGPFPSLGIAGAALATILSQVGAVGVFAVLAARGRPDLPLAWRHVLRVDVRLLGGVARVGTPTFLVTVGFAAVYLYFAHIAARLGAAAVAVVGIGNRLESICYLPGDGFAAASATIVGQNLGARDAGRAERGAWTAIALMGAFAALLTAVYLLVPGPLFDLFTTDPAVVLQGAPYLRVLALCQIAVGVETVLSGAFAGAGNTVPPLVIHVTTAAVRVPLAWALAIGADLGLMGIAWTISGTCVVRGLALAAWFSRGRWKTTRLPGAEVARA